MDTMTSAAPQAQTQDVVPATNMWAIKHNPSGAFLPVPRGRGGRGGTHVEVSDAGQPRMFASEVAARNALRWWLSGRVVVSQSEPWGVDFDEVHEDWRTESCPHRKAEDMSVVRVALTEVKTPVAEAVPAIGAAWKPMATAPSDKPAICIDIWCSDSECRRTDCFWFEGRWCYEVFEDKYRVVPVRSPVAWMPAPGKPEGV